MKSWSLTFHNLLFWHYKYTCEPLNFVDSVERWGNRNNPKWTNRANNPNITSQLTPFSIAWGFLYSWQINYVLQLCLTFNLVTWYNFILTRKRFISSSIVCGTIILACVSSATEQWFAFRRSKVITRNEFLLGIWYVLRNILWFVFYCSMKNVSLLSKVWDFVYELHNRRLCRCRCWWWVKVAQRCTVFYLLTADELCVWFDETCKYCNWIDHGNVRHIVDICL